MHIKGIDHARVEELHGISEREREIVVSSGHPYVAFLKKCLVDKHDFEMEEAIDLWNQFGIADFIDAMPDIGLRDKARRLTRPFPANTGAFSEVVINAIEHGSKFGENGEIVITLRDNQRSLLFSVLDYGEGFDLKMIETATQKEGSVRGNGLVSLKRCPAIVTCDKYRGKFRISLMSFI